MFKIIGFHPKVKGLHAGCKRDHTWQEILMKNAVNGADYGREAPRYMHSLQGFLTKQKEKSFECVISKLSVFTVILQDRVFEAASRFIGNWETTGRFQVLVTADASLKEHVELDGGRFDQLGNLGVV